MSKLAIHGGKPVRTKPLFYGHQWIDEEDIQAVVKVLRSDYLTMGPVVQEFEEAFGRQDLESLAQRRSRNAELVGQRFFLYALPRFEVTVQNQLAQTLGHFIGQRLALNLRKAGTLSIGGYSFNGHLIHSP